MQTSTSIIFQLTVTLRVKMGDTAEVQTFVNVLLNSRVLTAKNVGILFCRSSSSKKCNEFRYL